MQPQPYSTPSHMKRSAESEKHSKLPQISGSKENPARKLSASKIGSQKRMVEMKKATVVSASDKVLKDSSET